MSLNAGILTTGSILFHQFGSIGESQHVVPLDVIRYWNRNFVHERKSLEMLYANCVPLRDELLNTTTGRGLPRHPLPPVHSQARPAGKAW